MSQQENFRPYIRECENSECAFRYPVTEITGKEHICPACHGATKVAAQYPQHPQQAHDPVSSPKFSLLLDNVRSVFNVGSIFRSADGCGLVKHIYLCGITTTPDHPKMAKTSLGAEKNIPWSYHRNAVILAENLLFESRHLFALEATQQSVPLSQFTTKQLAKPFVIMVGNEVAGLDPALLALAEAQIHLPMHGIKESLNVAVATSILLYSLTN
jgi:23S rRNA (guanosine2251-2'-O)-methyltransferase